MICQMILDLLSDRVYRFLIDPDNYWEGLTQIIFWSIVNLALILVIPHLYNLNGDLGCLT